MLGSAAPRPRRPCAVPPRIVLALLLAVLPLAGACADEDDQERALSAREAGRALPLARILEREDEDGRVIYEVKVLGPDGRVRTLAYDAATGERVAHGEPAEDGD